MATEDSRLRHTRGDGRWRRPLAALSRLRRAGDVPVVVMLAWAGWLAVPWSFSGLAQARAAYAAAAAAPSHHQPAPGSSEEAPSSPASRSPGHSEKATAGGTASRFPAGSAPSVAALTRPEHASLADPDARQATWGIPAAHTAPVGTIRALDPPSDTADAAAVSATPAHPALPGTTPSDAAFSGTAPAEAALSGTAPAEAALSGTAPAEAALSGTAPADAVAVERARIAGVVHDVAGHGLAAIAMQAGVALVTLDDDPEQARASLLAIKETSTTALAQLRAALDGIDPPDGDLARLIDGVRAAGLPVDLDPPHLAVPARLQDTVYQVVRESLTNVLRHAGPTRAFVRASESADAFMVEVCDRGTGPRTEDVEGRGLSGMRARVLEAGGHLTTGPREGGGFQVLAHFPQAST
ncbi:histidine kinase [Nonomuraea sp. NPDC049421]|uniref:sensor histidine kinase n=1 Tax=Nonomuraea sp. NPDC049421 TaxID=3155275 RepID=UPI003413FE4F